MTASVVKRNLDFVANPANRSPLLGVGHARRRDGHGQQPARGTVVVTTGSPNPFMLQGLALVQMVCSRGLDDRNLLDSRRDRQRPVPAGRGGRPATTTRSRSRNGYRWGPGGATDRRAAAAGAGRSSGSSRTRRRRRTSCSRAGQRGARSSATSARAAEPAKALQRGRRSRRRSSSSSTRRPGGPAPTRAIRRALVQAMNLRQFGTVATSGRGVRVTQLTRQDRHPVPR